MNVPFVICDVFTDTRFGGNPLAVITDARGVSDVDMQRIAREFGFSETTFVLPLDDEGSSRDPESADASHCVRIFTPTSELPFAGHPNVGTAYVLAQAMGADAPESFLFLENAGLVEVSVASGEAGTFCEFRAPEPLSLDGVVDQALVAGAVGLHADEVSTARHAPQIASVGLPFIIAEVQDRKALSQARPQSAGFAAFKPRHGHRAVLLYARDDKEGIHCRMFVEHFGIVEDPATGSANGALAGLLASLDERADGELTWQSQQGDDMGRPSRLGLRVVKKNGIVTDVFVGGYSVSVAEGSLVLEN